MKEVDNKLYLNVVKGFAIFLMLWTHCIQYCAKDSFSAFDNTVFRVVYTFHMPLLMLISGYLYFFSFQKRDLKSLLKYRTQAMLQPIVFCTILHNVLMNLMYHFLSGNDTWMGGVLLNGFKNLYWFLWCVLASSVVVGIVCKVTTNTWIQAILLVLGACLLLLFPEPDFQLFMYPFFVIGFLWAKNREKLISLVKYIKYLVFLLFPLLFSVYKKELYIYHTPVFSEQYGLWENIHINMIRLSAGLMGSSCVMILIEQLFRLMQRRNSVPWVIRATGKLGKNSLQIYCLSVPFLSGYLPIIYDKAIQIMGENLPARNMTVFNFLFTPILAIAFSFGLYFIILLLKKCKIHSLIFGR